MAKRKKLDKKLLKKLFIDEELSISSIAREMDCSSETVKRNLMDYGLYIKKEPLRDEYGRFIYKNQVLPPLELHHHPQYKTGIDCYRKIAALHHKKECVHCYETENLDVHHIDENRHNNHPENLRFVCKPCHMKHEHSDRFQYRDKTGRFISKEEYHRLMEEKEEKE